MYTFVLFDASILGVGVGRAAGKGKRGVGRFVYNTPRERDRDSGAGVKQK